MTFAPGFDPTGLTLELSPDIGNSPIEPVPEPATLAMVILGFCGPGAMSYRRRGLSMQAARWLRKI